MSEESADGDSEDPIELELTGHLRERFEEERATTKTRDIPMMDPETFMKSLLDTHKAVREGYYNDE